MIRNDAGATIRSDFPFATSQGIWKSNSRISVKFAVDILYIVLVLPFTFFPLKGFALFSFSMSEFTQCTDAVH